MNLSDLLGKMNRVIIDADMEVFMGFFEPTSPYLRGIHAYWDFYIRQNRALASRLELIETESLGPGEQRVWVNHHVLYEGAQPQVVRCFMDIKLQPDGQWLLKSMDRILPIYGAPTHLPDNAPPIASSVTFSEKDSRVIGPESGGPKAYLEYVNRRYRQIRANPSISSALILANMMSQATARLLLPVYRGDRAEWLRRLAPYWNKHALHSAQARIPNRWPPNVHPMVRVPKQGVDDLVSMGAPTGQIVGLCDALHSTITSILLLGGIPPERVWEVTCEGTVTHVLTLVDEPDDGPLMVSVRYMTPAHGIPYHHNQVSSICNYRSYWSFNGRSNLTPSEVQDVLDLHARSSPSFDLASKLQLHTYRPSDHPSPPLVLPKIEGSSPALIAARVRKAVADAAQGNDDTVYSPAWYAYQSLHVRWPETYFLATVRSPVVTALAESLGDGLSPLFKWFEENVEEESIFSDPDRIMVGEQAVYHGKGGAWDKALFAGAFATLKGTQARCILTRTSGYLAYRQGTDWRYVDMKHHHEVSQPEGELVSAFDQESAFHPPADRQDFQLD